MTFELTILGVNGATPAYGRHPSAQVLAVSNERYLIDCGEGTQMRMLQYRIKRSKINHIFISHLHGDHIYGLIGLLTSYTLNNRQTPMRIFAPAGLQEIIEVQLRLTSGGLSYPLHFQETDTNTFQLIHEDQLVEVYSIPLQHRLPTAGFLFREKQRPKNVIAEQLQKYNIPYPEIPAIKQGADYRTPSGEIIPNETLTLPPYQPRSYAYCSDTQYTPSIVPYLKGIDLLYHESTFLSDRQEEATISMHSTAAEAAAIAKAAGVGQLILGHYSARYKDVSPILEEAQQVFQPSVLGEEGKCYGLELQRIGGSSTQRLTN